jgi:hypothetical protein
VNHLDIAPRYASIIFSISTTIAIVPGTLIVLFSCSLYIQLHSPSTPLLNILTGVVNVQLVGYMLESTNNNWMIPFMVSVGVYFIGAIVFLKWSRGKPISRKDRTNFFSSSSLVGISQPSFSSFTNISYCFVILNLVLCLVFKKEAQNVEEEAVDDIEEFNLD